MAYFRCVGGSGTGATITVTYGADFYGQTISCSNGIKTYTKTAPNTGTLDFTVYDSGTWTISCTISGETYSDTAEVDLTASAALEAIPNGSTVTPTDDVETWLACAGIKDKSYTTLSQVIGDSETFNALLGDSNACAYMKRSTTFASTLCADQYAMNLLGQYDTACDALLSDATWASAIANSTYFESVLNVKVPKMTSNTTPSGVASYTGTLYSSSYDAYKAFDGSEDRLSLWLASNNGTLMYEFASPMVLKAVRIVPNKYNTFVGKATTMYIDGYDGNDWVNLLEQSLSASDIAQENKFSVVNTTDYSKFRLRYDNGSVTYNGTNYCSCTALQLYGRTSSSEKIHGGNPTYDSFYRIVDGNHVPVTDPSLLDAGTYTIYSNGLAKDPDNLSNDYGKTIRICPNTKEIVVRPDNSLYWWGYENPNLEDLSSANGWSQGSTTLDSPTHNQTTISIVASGGAHISGIGTKTMLSSISAIKCIVKATTLVSNTAGKFNSQSSKTSFTYASGTGMDSTSNTLYTIDATSLGSTYYTITAYTGRAIDVSAVFYE